MKIYINARQKTGKNMLVRAALLICSSILINTCSEDNSSPVDTGGKPTIVEINMQNKWNIKIPYPYKIEVRVEDPQGQSDIDIVQFSVYDSDIAIYTDSLYDDGGFFHEKDGDVVAGDGIYTNHVLPAQIFSIENQGEFIVKFLAADNNGNESDVAERVVVVSSNSPPVILQLSAPSTYPWSEKNIVVNITVADSDGVEDVVSAYFDSEDMRSGVTRFEEILYNDGNMELHGDTVAGDSIFSVKLDSTFGAAKHGDYNLLFYAEDSYGNRNLNVQYHHIFIENSAPGFKSVFVPDSIVRPLSGYIHKIMTVEVADEQGLADIDSVYFYSLRPDSTWAEDKIPFQLVDNGLPFNQENPFIETGDLVAGDGIYSFSLIVDSNTILGTRTFYIYIRDKAGNLSGPQLKQIAIVED